MLMNKIKKRGDNFKNNSTEAQELTVCTEIEKKSVELLEAINDSNPEIKALYDELTEADNLEAYSGRVHGELASYRRVLTNLLGAYQAVLSTSDELGARWDDLHKSRRHKKKRYLPYIPANAEIDYAERLTDHFAQGINRYKLLLVCFIGSFFGVVIEMLWTLLHEGEILSRAGLVYGPFNLLYGFGAVALTLSLYRFRNHRKWLSFVGGMVIGSAVEYVCSFVQELVFGSRSWDYSGHPFNLNGRICLEYAIFWGVLGVLWVKGLYPLVAKWILKLPSRAGRILTATLLVFFVINAAATVLAIARWAQRIDGIGASGAFWEFIDTRFNDTRMEKIFPNMVFGK